MIKSKSILNDVGMGPASAAGLLANSFDTRVNPEKLAEINYAQNCTKDCSSNQLLKGN